MLSSRLPQSLLTHLPNEQARLMPKRGDDPVAEHRNDCHTTLSGEHGLAGAVVADEAVYFSWCDAQREIIIRTGRAKSPA